MAARREVGGDGGGADACQELVDIIVRAKRLGFSPQRVATALGVTPRQLASIERRISAARAQPAKGNRS